MNSSIGTEARGILIAARPKQWSKNLLVLAAPLAAGRLLDPQVLRESLLGLLVMILGSAGTYLLNDVRDRDVDAHHPTKRQRPIAAGTVRVSVAVSVGCTLLVLGFLTAFLPRTGHLVYVFVGYVALTTAYSIKIKEVPLLELAAVAAGFVLRAFAGAVVTGIGLSTWFLVVVSFASLYLVATKRYAEMRDVLPRDHRKVLTGYTIDALREVRYASVAVTLTTYVLWAFESSASGGSPWFEISVLPFTLALFQYAIAAHAGAGEAPEDIILSDIWMMIYGSSWAIIFALGVSFRGNVQ